jgi:L-threonylcarbamoyladenylate synthase
MNTKTIFALRDPDEAVREAAKLIKGGGIAVIPTETVYGLAANALDPKAVARIFAAKGRPADNPLIVHISGLSMLRQVVSQTNGCARDLMDAFWPGPLSIVLPRGRRISDIVTGGLDTVAVRMPAHPLALRIIEEAGVPVAAPSANTSGRPSPTTAMHAYEDMCGKAPLIIDGGPCKTGVESTVVGLAGNGGTPVILRPGAVTPGQIAAVCGQVRLHAPATGGDEPASPGMKYRHYAPRARVVLLQGDKKEVAQSANTLYDSCSEKSRNPVVFCADDCAAFYPGRQVRLLGVGSVQAQARLFAEFREADARGNGVILFQYTEDMGYAVKNRVMKAAEVNAFNTAGEVKQKNK